MKDSKSLILNSGFFSFIGKKIKQPFKQFKENREKIFGTIGDKRGTVILKPKKI